MTEKGQRPLIFSKGIDALRPWIGLVLAITPVYLLALLYYGGSPQTTDVGYQPVQPVPYSHALHAGELGIDCRYCHNTVESSARAAVPPTRTCMNCHTNILPDSEKLTLVRESWATGLPVAWVRVHDLPDYVFFNHSAHVTRGVGCVECHGRVDRMEQVYQDQKLSMGWCLDCHRNPEPRLRDVALVTDMEWQATPEERLEIGRRVLQEHDINPSEDCSTCHR